MTSLQVSTDKRIKAKEIKELAKKIESSSDFVKNLSKENRVLFFNIVERLRDDTFGELTDTEYEGISKMIFFCDRFEMMFGDMGVENVETEILDLYRKMKTQITVFLKDYREGKKVTPPSIQVIKNYMIKLDDMLDDIDAVELDDGQPEIIDLEVTDGKAVRAGENREDKGDDKEFSDSDSVEK